MKEIELVKRRDFKLSSPNKFYILKYDYNKGAYFEKVPAGGNPETICIEGFEKFDFFCFFEEKVQAWVLVNGITGMIISSSEQKEELSKKAQTELGKNKEFLEEMMIDCVERYGLSPRWCFNNKEQ